MNYIIMFIFSSVVVFLVFLVSYLRMAKEIGFNRLFRTSLVLGVTMGLVYTILFYLTGFEGYMIVIFVFVGLGMIEDNIFLPILFGKDIPKMGVVYRLIPSVLSNLIILGYVMISVM